MEDEIDIKGNKSFDISPLELFLNRTITPLELSAYLDELLLDYGKMFLFAATTSTAIMFYQTK